MASNEAVAGPPTSVSSSTSLLSAKMRKRLIGQKEMDKVLQLAPLSKPSNTLAEMCAKTLAEAWSRDNDLMPDFCDTAISSTLGLIFKIQIAIFLKGMHLARWIQRQGGLVPLSKCDWPDLFQKLLTAVCVELGRIEQTSSCQCLLRRLLEHYQDHIRTSPDIQHTLHRLGMTNYFAPGKSNFDDNPTVYYYWYQQDRCLNFREKIPMVMPLPFPLQIDSFQIEQQRKDYYISSKCIRENLQEWSEHVTEEEFFNEKKGKILSAKTLLDQRALREVYFENYTSSERFISCISVMARSQTNGNYAVVLITALFSLLHPFYSAKSEPDAPFLRTFRIDIFWFLSNALCSFYALLDLPLACLKKAQTHLGSFPCLSEQMRYALMFQKISVSYGHWRSAQLVFDQWFYRVPPVSWLFEELVLNHIVGLFWQMENSLVEMYVTNIFHKKCKNTCWKEFMKLPYIKLRHIKLKINSIVYGCMSDKTISQQFSNNLQIAAYLNCYFDITLKKLDWDKPTAAYDQELKKIWQKLSQKFVGQTSRHLTPFMHVLPYFIGSQYYWDHTIESHFDTLKKLNQTFSCTEHSKQYADQLFSLVTCMLYHNRFDSFFHIIQATLETYRKSTAKRHYRIPLLERLLQVYRHQEEHQLKIEPTGSDVIHSVPVDDLTAVDMTNTAIRNYSAAMSDAYNDFKNVDMSNDDKFCLYLRQRDPLMPAWINFGLEILRFADCL